MEFPGGTVRGMSVRTFDPASGRWSSRWLDSRDPSAIGAPVRGAFADGVGTLVGDDTLDGRPVTTRVRWSGLTASSARWEQACSGDGGATWETNWISEFKRASRAIVRGCIACSPALIFAGTSAAAPDRETTVPAPAPIAIVGQAAVFAPGIASTEFAEIRLTLSPDGRTALWFSRNRPGGPGGYDIWMTRKNAGAWMPAIPVPFNSPTRDFDPAFSPDGRYVYFCSDRPGSLGGDDLYRVAVTAGEFGGVEHLGARVNSAGNEFAPMLSPNGTRLLFSSDRPGGAGRHDLYAARHRAGRFEPARALPGGINTPADEFDATFLSDGATIVFARAGDFRTDRVDLFVSAHRSGRYDVGVPLPPSINSGENDTYGPMLDWSNPDRLTFSGQRAGAQDMDLYLVRYRLQ